MKNFIAALSIGFMVGSIGIISFMGPLKIREQVCQGYVENHKPLSLSREEKQTYLEKYRLEQEAKQKTNARKLSSQDN